MARNDSIGYLTVGSGAEPANSAFIRSRYDDTCEVNDALLSVMEAKAQAEEVQGVGQNMDIAVLSDEGRRDLSDDEIDELRNVYDSIVKAERTARQETVEEKGYSFSP